MTEHRPNAPAPGPAPDVRVAEVVRAAAGAAGVLQVTVTNNAAGPREMAVLVVGVDQAWLPGPVRSRALAPGESETVEVRVTPAVGTLPARYPMAVTVQALAPGAAASAEPSAVGECALVVNPRAQLQLEVAPQQCTLVRSQRIDVLLTNSGPAPVALDLATTASRGLEVRLRRRSVRVPAGGETRLKGRVVATRPRWFGVGQQHSWSLTATGPDVVRRMSGTVQQRAVLGPGWIKAVAVLAVLAVWVVAAVVFIPRIADRFGSQEEDATTIAAEGEGGDDTASDGDGSGSGSGDDRGSGDGPTVTQAKSAATPTGLQLNGTITAEDPAGVTVTLEPTSLVDEEAQGAENADDLVELSGYGKTPREALLLRAPDRVPSTRTATTPEDGTWSFPKVRAPGYYLITFSKLGYESQSYVIDSSAEDASDPLEVALEPGDGALSGVVSGPDGRVPAATVTISDGTNTITTSSASKGNTGAWSVDGLATPGDYVVEVSKFGLGTESRLVGLDAGGRATADLHLRTGVAAIVGRISGTPPGGEPGGLGGISVTATDEQGQQRSTTTVTRSGQAGSFKLSGLPSPGTYTVTLSGEGFQSQTSAIEFKEGDGRAELNETMVTSTGSVVGSVREKGDETHRLVGAGLTLSDGEHVYKTTSTSEDVDTVELEAGEFSFDGVEPGVYQLTTEYFEFTRSVLTVRVKAGRPPTRAQPRIAEIIGGSLPAKSRIRGTAVDANSGDALPCDDADPCLASIDVEQPDGSFDVVTDEFAGDEEYILPEALNEGIEPGLYTVTVSASGYESAQVRVQVPLDGEAFAPTAELTPVPLVTGTLSVTRGSTDPGTEACIWAVPQNTALPTTPCAATTDTECRPDGTPTPVLDPGTQCVKVDMPPGSAPQYELELPAAGPYTLLAQLTDEAYAPINGIPVNVAPGSTVVQNLQFVRQGEIQVFAHTVDADGNPAPATGISVTVARVLTDGSLGTPKTQVSGGSGLARFVGLLPGTYRITATDPAATNPAVSETADVIVEVDQIREVLMTLGKDPGVFVGRVYGDEDPLTGDDSIGDAQVAIRAPSGWTGLSPDYVDVTVASDTDGCYTVHAPRPPGTLPAIGACDDTYAAASDVEAQLASDWAGSIRITKTGYVDQVLGRTQLLSVLAVRLEPKPVDFTSSLTSIGAVPSYADTAFTVTSSTTPTTTVSVSSDAYGALTWNDTRYATGDIRPGTYTITASLPGYVSDPVTFTCDVAAPCTPTGPVLKQFAGLKVLAVDIGSLGGSTPVNDVIVTLKKNGQTVATKSSANDDNEVVFTGLVPEATDYTLRVQAAGYEFSQGTLSCVVTPPAGEPDPPATTSITIEPGRETVCTDDLTRLARVTGRVQGVLAAPPAASPVRSLAGASVTLTRCTDWTPNGAGATPQYCTGVGAREFSALSRADGTFTITGTNQVEGITDGVWLLRAAASGWTLAVPGGAPADALPGIAVEVASSADVSEVVQLHVDPVDFDAIVEDQYGGAVTGATVQLLKGTTVVATGTAVTGDPGTYRFTGAIPGTYTLRASGNGVVTSTAQVEILVGVSPQSYLMAIGRAANSLSGRVLGDDRPAGLEGAKAELFSCPSGGGACAATVSNGTDGQPLRATTSATGAFELRTVPDGTYQVEFSGLGYGSTTAGPFVFDHNQAAVPALTATLTHTSRNVTVDVGPTGNGLDGATVTLTPVTGFGNVAPAPQTLSGGSTTFNQLRFGCWDISVTLPDRHHGSIGYPADTTDPDLSCSGMVVVPPAPSADPLSASVSVNEKEVQLTVTATPQSGHPTPTTANVRVQATGVDFTEEVPIGGGSVSVWVSPGTYDFSATIGDTGFSSVFWPAVTDNNVGVSGATAVPVTLALAEKTSRLRVSSTNGAVITVAPDPTQTASVPAAYAAGVTVTGGSEDLHLPSGKWNITATLGTDSTTMSVDLDALNETLTIAP